MKASRAEDRERRLQKIFETFEWEDPQDGTDFDCALITAVEKLKAEFGIRPPWSEQSLG